MAATRLPLEEFARLPSCHAVEVSFQGDRAAILADHSGRLELWLLDLRTGARTQVSNGEMPRACHAGLGWARDGQAVYFHKDRDGDEQHDAWRFDLATGTATQLTDTPQAQDYLREESPDGQWLVLQSNRGGQMNVWKLRLADGAVEPLTDFSKPTGAGHWSPDGRWLTVGANFTADLLNSDGYLITADGSELRRVFRTAIGAADHLGRWHPDGRRLTVWSEIKGLGRVGLLSWEDGELRWFGTGEHIEHGGQLSRDGRWVAATRERDARTTPLLYDVETGVERALELPVGISVIVDFCLDDTALLVSHHGPTSRPQLLLYHLDDDRTEVVLPAEYGKIDPGVFVDAEYVHYDGADGWEIPAILYLPRDASEPAARPAIVAVHGGPWSQWNLGFNAYAQFLADRGYVVLMPNPRGSTGYGKEFREANLHDWGGKDLEDVANGAEYLKSHGLADPSRIGIFGGSYGGYMTFMQVVKKPELWKAGVAWVGITDLLAMYEESMEHFRTFLRMFLGDPVEDAGFWRERSAITYADQLKAKLLIVHGLNDPRCPISQARLFRDKLLSLGYREGDDFEYVELADEGHGSTDGDQKVRTYRLLADFMDRRL